MRSRVCVVTGSASGIGAATAATLSGAGDTVIGVDLRGAEVDADLSTAEGRATMVAAVQERTGGVVDVVVANAGVSTGTALDASVNYFGAVATLEGLRPMLARSEAPRASVTVSSSIHLHVDDTLVEACLAGDEPAARAAADAAGMLAYGSTKRALGRWIRRVAATDDWAGAGIPLNGVAPGIVRTAMTAAMDDDPGVRELFDAAVPMPLGGHAEPADIARVHAFLVAPDNVRMTGQVIFVDGGADLINRSDDIWHPG